MRLARRTDRTPAQSGPGATGPSRAQGPPSPGSGPVGGVSPPDLVGRTESVAFLSGQESAGHFDAYADQGRSSVRLPHRSADWLVAFSVLLFFLGGYAIFIVVLALTR